MKNDGICTWKRLLKSCLTLALTAVMLFQIMPTEASAASDSWRKFKGIDQKASPYYTEATGNGAADMIAVARAQLGQHSGDIGFKEGNNWCAAFLSNCAIAVGQQTAIPYSSNAAVIQNKAVDNAGAEIIFFEVGVSYPHGNGDVNGHANKKVVGSINNAQPGDLITYYTKNKGTRSHVELITEVKKDSSGNVTKIISIGGNRRDKNNGGHYVAEGYYSNKISAIVRPNYTNTSYTSTNTGNNTDLSASSKHNPVETYSQATERIKGYLDQCEGRYWNTENKMVKSELAARYEELKYNADTENYSKNTTTTACPRTKGNHGFTDDKCRSNVFDSKLTYGLSQCEGFVHYMSYVLFGESGYLQITSGKGSDSNYTYNWDKVSWNTLGNEELETFEVHPGDIIRYTTTNAQHFVMVYQVKSDGSFTTVEGNYDGKCRIGTRDWTLSDLKDKLKKDSGCYVLKSPLNEKREFTFAFSGGEGGMGSVSPVTIEYKGKLNFPQEGMFTRDGYVLDGYYVQRSDGKWICSDGKSWQTESSISNNNYTLRSYTPGDTKGIDDSWLKNYDGSGTPSFMVIAQWKEAADSYVENIPESTPESTPENTPENIPENNGDIEYAAIPESTDDNSNNNFDYADDYQSYPENNIGGNEEASTQSELGIKESLPTYIRLYVDKTVYVKSMPYSRSGNANSDDVTTVNSGDYIIATAIQKNAYDNYWYKVTVNGCEGYINANEISGYDVPEDIITAEYGKDLDSIQQGKKKTLYGTISSKAGIGTVYGALYSYDAMADVQQKQVDNINMSTYKINGGPVDKSLKVGELAAGSYAYHVSVSATYYYAPDEKTLLQYSVQADNLIWDDFEIY